MSDNKNWEQESSSTKSPNQSKEPRPPSSQTGSKILNLIAKRSEEVEIPKQAPKAEGTMRQLSLPKAPGLSVDAPVFVPMKNRTPQVDLNNSSAAAATGLSAEAPEFYYGDQNNAAIYDQEAYVNYYLGEDLGDLKIDDYDQPYYPTSTEKASIEERFDFALKILTMNPTNVEEYLKPICDDIASTPSSENVTSRIVENLYVQCIGEENFRYTGARICQYLNKSVKMEPSFIKAFVRRCKVDFDKREQMLAGSPEERHKLQGLSMLLAEVFINVETSAGDGTVQHLAFLPPILIQAVETLLSAAEETNIKCACQMLKLTGSLIEDVVKVNPEQCLQFEGLFTMFRSLLTKPEVSEYAKFHIERIIALKENEWNTSQVSNDSNNPYQNQAPIFYDQTTDDSNTHELTEEEELDFWAWQCDDEFKGMGNDMEEAYEEFLRQQQPDYNAHQPDYSYSQQMPAASIHQQQNAYYQQYNSGGFSAYPPASASHYPPQQYVHPGPGPYHYNSSQQHAAQQHNIHHQQYHQEQHQQHHHHQQQQQQPHQGQFYHNQNSSPQNDKYHYTKK